MKIKTISVVLMMLLGATGAGVSAQPGAPGAERFVLTGMVVWSGEEGVAWLQEPDLTRNQVVVLRIGESVGSWKLTRFLNNGVELDGPTGKVLVPLQNVGGGGSAVAAGSPAGPAPAASTARALPGGDTPPVAAPPTPASPQPGSVGESNLPAPNAGALGEALDKARADRARRQAGSVQNQPREAGPAGSQAVEGSGTASGTTSSGGASSAGSGGTGQVGGGSAGSGGTGQVIQLPVGGGKQGFRELFGHR